MRTFLVMYNHERSEEVLQTLERLKVKVDSQREKSAGSMGARGQGSTSISGRGQRR